MAVKSMARVYAGGVPGAGRMSEAAPFAATVECYRRGVTVQFIGPEFAVCATLSVEHLRAILDHVESGRQDYPLMLCNGGKCEAPSAIVKLPLNARA